jgi:hypothetical protein
VKTAAWPCVLLAVALAACSGGAAATTAGFPAEPYTTTTSDAGTLVVDVRTSPQPPVRGSNSVELTVSRAADGTPVPGLGVVAQTWMPAMNHGSSTPTVSEEGEGKYLVTGVYLYMPGTWQLRTTFSGSVSDHATLTLTVP